MIDLHTHVLPGMDDGSRSPEESARMLRELAAQGVTLAAATPHFTPAKTVLTGFCAAGKRRGSACSRLWSRGCRS